MSRQLKIQSFPFDVVPASYNVRLHKLTISDKIFTKTDILYGIQIGSCEIKKLQIRILMQSFYGYRESKSKENLCRFVKNIFY